MASASWCAPCRLSYPAMKQLRENGYIVHIVEFDRDHSDYIKKLDINLYPTFIIYEDGVEKTRTIGRKTTQWFYDNAVKPKPEPKPEPKPAPKPEYNL